jgi:Tfp pilus assembly protein PilF
VQAQKMWLAGLAAAPDDVATLFNLASLYDEFGKNEEARGMYERALAADPKHFTSLVCPRAAPSLPTSRGPRG